ncbi:MAG: P22 phage major capsid protein family protein [Candidatus Rickettsiella isopodorum]|nr:P22 phage major capsid protein family protein [Candidatus Rickettsiella isopodorum]
MGLGTNHNTVTTGANFIRTVWSKKLIIATESNLVAANLVQRYDTDAKLGRTIVVPNISNLSAVDKTASAEIDFQVTTEASTNITINKHKVVPFLIEDALKYQEDYDLASIYGKKASYGISKQIDTDVLTLAASAGSNYGTYNTDIVLDKDILDSIVDLDDSDVPQSERAFVMQPKLKSYMLFTYEKFYSAAIRGDKVNPIPKGAMMELYGIPLYFTTNIYASGDNVSNCLLHKEALALAINLNAKVEKGRIIQYLADAYVAQALYGCRIMRDDFIIELRS